MTIRIAILSLISIVCAVPSLAGPSGQHSANAAGHSGQAASEGSAAVASGTAAVMAVPIVVFGAGLAISGAAIADVGVGGVALGNDLSRVGTGQPVLHQGVTPDPAPTLD
ncbi:hypothetical protein GV827_22805 [Sulfitobacter sp. JBTF-M27]|uniref:Uncharacterized protein n=1 Tax=Sulfitobacter sediminilitoris TaxID=2698830 RepID=A0A6P0CIG5_9RHOB|nr:hypothetical protein [Sulfitobacter sediminilitoris]NEK25200.1 hypothetical protein [Sulfitobacter sediminilitoris]